MYSALPMRKRQRSGYCFETGCYDIVQAIHIFSGSLSFDRSGTVETLRPGRGLLLRRNDAFRLFCSGEGYEGVGVRIVDEEPFLFSGPSLALVSTEAIRASARLLEVELERTGAASRRVLEAASSLLAAQVVRLARRQGQGDPAEVQAGYWAESVRTLLERNLYNTLSVEEVCAGQGLGMRQLSRHFRARYGLTPKRYQMLRRIEEARQLLSGTALSVTSIALELGFPSSQHFATRFREVCGETPTAFRAAAEGGRPHPKSPSPNAGTAREGRRPTV